RIMRSCLPHTGSYSDRLLEDVILSDDNSSLLDELLQEHHRAEVLKSQVGWAGFCAHQSRETEEN
ncbi:MAG: hypothetical protein JZU65_20580, partial [Chlorobium sp.]|nr:hypothetical protein [Chlorobium sp.]